MKILITGASGNLGSYVAKELGHKYELILTDIIVPKQKSKNFKKVNLADFNAMKKLFRGVDVVLHFGASCSKNTPWEDLLSNNILGTRNVFEAAYQNGCKRVVFASSINAVNGYSEGKQIPFDALPKPPNSYGATKVFGEALGSYYSDEKNLSVLCLRFGRIVDKNDKRIKLENKDEEPFPKCDRFIIFEDALQIIQKCIVAPKKVKFGIFNALSDNREKRLDILSSKKILKYKPEYDSYKIAEKNIL